MGTVRRLPGVLLSLLLIAAPTLATPPATTRAAADPDLPELIARLSSKDFGEFRDARDRLSLLDVAAVPALRKAAERATDPEARRELQAAIWAIKPGNPELPTRVTLHLHNASAADAFAELARQSEVTLPVYPTNLWRRQPNDLPRVTVDLENATYWTAMRAVCRQAGMTFRRMGGGDDILMATLLHEGGNWPDAPAVERGQFMVMAGPVVRNDDDGVQRSFTVTLQIFNEFRLHVLEIDPRPQLKAAVGENDHSLVPRRLPDEHGVAGTYPTDEFPARLKVRLNAGPAPAAKRIAILQGSVHVRLQMRGGRVVFNDPVTAQNVTQTVGRHRFTLDSCRPTRGGMYDVSITAYRDGLSAEQWQALVRSNHSMRIVDTDGTICEQIGGSVGYDDNQMQLICTLHKISAVPRVPVRDGEPMKIVWDFPEEVRDVSVPFEFHDLPIP